MLTYDKFYNKFYKGFMCSTKSPRKLKPAQIDGLLFNLILTGFVGIRHNNTSPRLLSATCLVRTSSMGLATHEPRDGDVLGLSVTTSACRYDLGVDVWWLLALRSQLAHFVLFLWGELWHAY